MIEERCFVPAGTQLYNVGDRAKDIIHLNEGRVILSESSPCTANLVIAVLSGPNVLSLATFTLAQEHKVAAQAWTDCELDHISPEYFGSYHLRSMLDYSLQLEQEVILRSTAMVGQRLAHLLLQLAPDQAIYPITHQMLADMIGSRRETITVAARQMQDSGWISYDYGVLKVSQHGDLERFATEGNSYKRIYTTGSKRYQH